MSQVARDNFGHCNPAQRKTPCFMFGFPWSLANRTILVHAIVQLLQRNIIILKTKIIFTTNKICDNSNNKLRIITDNKPQKANNNKNKPNPKTTRPLRAAVHFSCPKKNPPAATLWWKQTKEGIKSPDTFRRIFWLETLKLPFEDCKPRVYLKLSQSPDVFSAAVKDVYSFLWTCLKTSCKYGLASRFTSRCTAALSLTGAWTSPPPPGVSPHHMCPMRRLLQFPVRLLAEGWWRQHCILSKTARSLLPAGQVCRNQPRYGNVRLVVVPAEAMFLTACIQKKSWRKVLKLWQDVSN